MLELGQIKPPLVRQWYAAMAEKGVPTARARSYALLYVSVDRYIGFTPRSRLTPQDPGPVEGLYDAPRLAQRLGLTTATLRQHRLADPRPTWLPEPAGELNGGAVWRADDLARIEDQRRTSLRPGRRTDLERARADADPETSTP